MSEDQVATRRSLSRLLVLAMLLALVVPAMHAWTGTRGAPTREEIAASESASPDDADALEQRAETVTIDAMPESMTNATDETHTITVRYFDPVTFAPVELASNERIVVRVASGPNTGATIGTCTVAGSGACQASYQGVATGKDFVEAFIDRDGDGLHDQGEPRDRVNKTWVSPTDAGEVTRLASADQSSNITEAIGTAIAISQNSFPSNDSAGAVVIATAAKFPDALAGVALAANKNAPLLLVSGDLLTPAAIAELNRVLPDGPSSTVYLLGGQAAVPQNVKTQIDGQNKGYTVRRLSGDTRFDTAIEIAKEMGNPDNLFVVNAFRFPDAVVAGPAAAKVGGAILLTDSAGKNPITEAYLHTRTGVTLYAVGGSAVNPYANQAEVTRTFAGINRYHSARRVAEFFFPNPTTIGFSRAGTTGFEDDPLWADAVTGSVHIGKRGGPLLFLDFGQIPMDTERFACHNADTLTTGFVYGANGLIGDTILLASENRIKGMDCRVFDTPG